MNNKNFEANTYLTTKENDDIINQLTNKYSRDNFLKLVGLIFNDFKEEEKTEDSDYPKCEFDRNEESFKSIFEVFESITKIGTCQLKCEDSPTNLENNRIIWPDLFVFEVRLSETGQKQRIKFTQAIYKAMDAMGAYTSLIAFVDPDENTYRYSLLVISYDINEKSHKLNKLPPELHRYSYNLGIGAKTQTIAKFLINVAEKVNTVQELMARFSVDAVNKEFYKKIADEFNKLIPMESDGIIFEYKDLKIKNILTSRSYSEFAVRLIGRIVFCWFLKEKKSSHGIPLVSDALLSVNSVEKNKGYYHSVLEPLFFEALNTEQDKRKERFKNDENYKLVPFLNGGLFSPDVNDFYGLDNITINDEWFSRFFSILSQYNFTVDENTSAIVDLSIDPEMLGRIFENLLAEVNVNDEDEKKSIKKSTGSYYTPREIVDFMVDSALLEFIKEKTKISEEKLSSVLNSIDKSNMTKDEKESINISDYEKKEILKCLHKVTIFDPACGSGAFPIGLLQKIVYIL
ncbi:MAG: hypothetical protein LBU04_02495, partial [Christensenellaceae bacterium]|nr:hypothetical protein [Christensenellaceae bacterium]